VRPDPAAAFSPASRSSALLTICLIETLERYGSYLIAALLPLFLNEHLHWPAGLALRLVGYYLALGYAGGVAGGFLADRWLGYRGATRVGAALLGVGAALLTSGQRGTLYPALALLILGSCCFKPALSAWLGSLYATGDPGRGAGFAWLYFTANVGALLAPFVGGFLRTHYSWPVAFATTAGAFGLVLLIVVVGQSSHPQPEPVPEAEAATARAVASPTPSLRSPRWRTPLALLLVVMLFSVAYGQSGGALLFFARDQVDRRVLGWVIPPDFFASVPAALVLILTALQQVLWRALTMRRRAPAPVTTLLTGMVASSIAFALLAAVAAAHRTMPSAPLLGALWIVAALTLLTVGEVLVIPVAMALVSQSAPPGQGALAQGLLSAAMALGLALAGEAGRFLEQWGAPRFFAATAAVPMLGVLVLWSAAERWNSSPPSPDRQPVA
jgi:POT family proton-dependent oligopeptide transporter